VQKFGVWALELVLGLKQNKMCAFKFITCTHCTSVTVV